MPCSPRRRIRLVTVASELAALPNPVGFEKASADLASATDARTTRFCRTLKCRSFCPPHLAHEVHLALRLRLPAQRSRVHRIQPRVRNDRDTPLRGGGREKHRSDLGQVERNYFRKIRKNDLTAGKSVFFQRGHSSSGGRRCRCHPSADPGGFAIERVRGQCGTGDLRLAFCALIFYSDLCSSRTCPRCGRIKGWTIMQAAYASRMHQGL